MSVNAQDFRVFEAYRNAPAHAFSNNIVSEADKDSYNAIFEHLRNSISRALNRSLAANEFEYWNCRFYRDGGIQGQRPVDLWVSIINKDSDAFSKFPQVYVIASEKGIEVGFSVTIHEDDYYNTELQRKNRSIIPIINSKLPPANSPIVQDIQDVLSEDDRWKYAEKARQGPISSFESFAGVIAHLKSGDGSPKGGGSVYRIFSFEEIAESESRLENEVLHTLNLFLPIMRLLRPTAVESGFVANLIELATIAEQIPQFDPTSAEDGRQKVLREVAVRQGQAKFRDELMQAYNGRCAISGCTLAPTLQAAHISPYNGDRSNHVSNGILLRADIHTLFDLGLLKIDPDTREVCVVPSLSDTEYAQYSGKVIAKTAKPGQSPSVHALRRKLEMFPAD